MISIIKLGIATLACAIPLSNYATATTELSGSGRQTTSISQSSASSTIKSSTTKSAATTQLSDIGKQSSSFSKSLRTSDVPQIGTWGSVTWSFDSNKATLTFTGSGVLGTSSTSPWTQNEEISKALQKIIFTQPVELPEDSSSLFTDKRIDLVHLKSIEGMKNLSTSRVLTMDSMFLGDSALTQLDLSSFNTSKVTDMDWMFYAANSLTQLDLSSFDTSRVLTMDSMFLGDVSLTQLDLSSFDTSDLTLDVDDMFKDDTALSSLTLGERSVVSQSTNLPKDFLWRNSERTWSGISNALYYQSEKGIPDTYYRVTIAGPITINYVDENGSTLHDSQILTGVVGDAYDASSDKYQLKISGYDLDKSKLPAVKGTLDTQTHTITYVYKKIAGPITINYVDENGSTLHDSQILTGVVGDAYDASSDKYQLKISGYDLDKSKLPAVKGTLDTQTHTITYVYKKIAGPITINYVDENGSTLHDSQILTGVVGDAYDASSDKYQLKISGYDLDKSKLPAVKGTLDTQTHTITYVYKKIAGPITINYVDENGSTLHDSQILTGVVGDAYDASSDKYQLKISGYDLDKSKLPAVKGTLDTQTHTITYVYKKIAGPITINYVDENGSTLHDSQILTGVVGDAYDASSDKYQLKISGYDLDKSKLPAVKGTLDTQTHTITYVYKKIAGPITINYVDENGSTLHDSQILTGVVGDAYDASSDKYQLKISGYDLDKSKLPAVKGTLDTQTHTITYVYKKIAGPITINYVDENGSTLHDSQILTGVVGDAYDASSDKYQLKISGYDLDKSKLPAVKGTLDTQTHTITYVYKKIAGPIGKKKKSSSGISNLGPTLGDASLVSNAHLKSNNSPQKKNASAKSLPQAGENQISSDSIIIFGFLILTLGMLIIIIKNKKSK